MENIKQVGEIGNYYGRLQIATKDGKFYWGVPNYNGTEWEEISEKLYTTILSECNATDPD